MAQHIYTGTTPPTEAPKGVGHHYIDKVAKSAYLSVGTDAVSDWKLVSGGQGSGASEIWKKVPVPITEQTVSQNYFEVTDLADLNTAALGRKPQLPPRLRFHRVQGG